MKKLMHFMFLIFIACWQVNSQCDPRLSMKVPDNPDHFIKSFDAFMPYKNDTVLKYTLLLHQGKKYRIEVFENDEYRGGATYSLYEGNKLIGTNYAKARGKSYPSFDFICQKSLVYDMVVRKNVSGKYCASWVIQEMKESGEGYFEFSDQEASGKGDENIFVIVDHMPEFIEGKGMEAFRDWIAQNMVYPAEAIQKGISGKVFVTFVVDENGNVIRPKVVRGVDPILDKAAFELIKSSPRWFKPGSQRGIKVKVAYTFPLKYELKPKEDK